MRWLAAQNCGIGNDQLVSHSGRLRSNVHLSTRHAAGSPRGEGQIQPGRTKCGLDDRQTSTCDGAGRPCEFSNKGRMKRYPALTSTGASYGARNQPDLQLKGGSVEAGSRSIAWGPRAPCPIASCWSALGPVVRTCRSCRDSQRARRLRRHRALNTISPKRFMPAPPSEPAS
jgi:hypothetical protein